MSDDKHRLHEAERELHEAGVLLSDAYTKIDVLEEKLKASTKDNLELIEQLEFHGTNVQKLLNDFNELRKLYARGAIHNKIMIMIAGFLVGQAVSAMAVSDWWSVGLLAGAGIFVAWRFWKM